MPFVVYILYSAQLDGYYIGYTGDDIDMRLRKHNSNHKGYTGKVSDWVVGYTELYEDKIEAMKREKQIKGWKSRRMIETLVARSVGSGHPD